MTLLELKKRLGRIKGDDLIVTVMQEHEMQPRTEQCVCQIESDLKDVAVVKGKAVILIGQELLVGSKEDV